MMNARAQTVKNFLDKLFPNPGIPLKHKNPYTLLIAVVLSARCTDKKVNEITPHLFNTASTPQEMAKLPQSLIQSIIRPCGLSPAKSKALKTLSQILLDEYEGEVPQTFEDLERLPGVGHKTASVVMAQAFNIPAFPIDTHIHRCAKRWGLSSGKNVVQTEKDLKKHFPKESWIKLHLQIIYYAREYCPSRGHIKEDCPICKNLAASRI